MRSSNFTYDERADSRTARRSYMPLTHSPPFTMSGGESEFAYPVGDEDVGRQVAAGRVATDVDTPGIASEARGVLRDPGDRAPHLRDHAVEADVHHGRELRDDPVGAGLREGLGRVGLGPRVATAPGAAVGEDHDRRARPGGGIDVEALHLRGTVREAARRA